MAIEKGDIPIYGVLKNNTPDNKIAKAEQIWDDSWEEQTASGTAVKGKAQDKINDFLKKEVSGKTSLSNAQINAVKSLEEVIRISNSDADRSPLSLHGEYSMEYPNGGSPDTPNDGIWYDYPSLKKLSRNFQDVNLFEDGTCEIVGDSDDIPYVSDTTAGVVPRSAMALFNSDYTLKTASKESAGVMSSADKETLDNLSDTAEHREHINLTADTYDRNTWYPVFIVDGTSRTNLSKFTITTSLGYCKVPYSERADQGVIYSGQYYASTPKWTSGSPWNIYKATNAKQVYVTDNFPLVMYFDTYTRYFSGWRGEGKTICSNVIYVRGGLSATITKSDSVGRRAFSIKPWVPGDLDNNNDFGSSLTGKNVITFAPYGPIVTDSAGNKSITPYPAGSTNIVPVKLDDLKKKLNNRYKVSSLLNVGENIYVQTKSFTESVKITSLGAGNTCYVMGYVGDLYGASVRTIMYQQGDIIPALTGIVILSSVQLNSPLIFDGTDETPPRNVPNQLVGFPQDTNIAAYKAKYPTVAFLALAITQAGGLAWTMLNSGTIAKGRAVLRITQNIQNTYSVPLKGYKSSEDADETYWNAYRSFPENVTLVSKDVFVTCEIPVNISRSIYMTEGDIIPKGTAVLLQTNISPPTQNVVFKSASPVAQEPLGECRGITKDMTGREIVNKYLNEYGDVMVPVNKAYTIDEYLQWESVTATNLESTVYKAYETVLLLIP